jgi:GNAT superfamily N-acetyltransferase
MSDGSTAATDASALAGDDACIRRATSRDLDRVVALWSALTQHHADSDPVFAPRPGADLQIRRLLDVSLRDPDTAIFVSEGENRFNGYCTARVDRAPPILLEVERAEICDLLVTAEARRRGIGRALVVRALHWAKDQGVARCEVRVHVRNAEGQAFWRSQGFEDWMDVLHRQL